MVTSKGQSLAGERRHIKVLTDRARDEELCT